VAMRLYTCIRLFVTSGRIKVVFDRQAVLSDLPAELIELLDSLLHCICRLLAQSGHLGSAFGGKAGHDFLRRECLLLTQSEQGPT
jgi:hypothetical protein